jgi:CDP-4-dehydro-6-deoxyglucose reductase, E1
MNEAMKNSYPRVPYGTTVHGQAEIDAVVKVLQTSTQMGPNVREFEKKIAQISGKRHGVMVNSGSSALMLAMELIDLEEGVEVLTPALTFSTTVSYIVRNNLVPAFVDVEEGTYLIDVEKVEEMITPRTRAVVIPHLIGNVFDWRTIQPLVEKYDLKIIEDSADTLGGTIKNQPSGNYADISITSFYGSHIINCAGNGGMISVDDDEYDRIARILRSWGRSSSVFSDSESIDNRFSVELEGVPYDAKFVFEKAGHNIEPSELGAAFGLVQLDNLGENIRRRQSFYRSHVNFFRKYEDFFILPRQTEETETGWLAFPLTVRASSPFSRRDFQIFLEKRNIQTRVIFSGNIVRQPGFMNFPKSVSKSGYPEADKVMRGGVLLACHHGLDLIMLDHLYESVEDFLRPF